MHSSCCFPFKRYVWVSFEWPIRILKIIAYSLCLRLILYGMLTLFWTEYSLFVSLGKSVTDLKARSMRENLIFSGIPKEISKNSPSVSNEIAQSTILTGYSKHTRFTFIKCKWPRHNNRTEMSNQCQISIFKGSLSLTLNYAAFQRTASFE